MNIDNKLAQALRDGFEKWVHGCWAENLGEMWITDLSKDEHGRYLKPSAERAFLVWQAAHDAREGEPSPIHGLSVTDGDLADYLWRVLDYYANPYSYIGERTGGILQGCPRGPNPAAQEMTHEAEIAKRRLKAAYDAAQKLSPEHQTDMLLARTVLREVVIPQAQPQPSVADHGFFVGGPHASAIVYDRAHIEPVIAALCSVTEDDPEDYTATDLAAPQPAQGVKP